MQLKIDLDHEFKSKDAQIIVKVESNQNAKEIGDEPEDREEQEDQENIKEKAKTRFVRVSFDDCGWKGSDDYDNLISKQLIRKYIDIDTVVIEFDTYENTCRVIPTRELLEERKNEKI